ncbi:unnamed protein product [Enterobius vermicularis]|uniref:protein-tyrosine-phosphatase n=1 Tax=Enterobius vermicularis TaxID=51028 RepID=A0A0N4VBL9_ENTVE|nr:unnamed protein product [Enterobius vermicularis]
MLKTPDEKALFKDINLLHLTLQCTEDDDSRDSGISIPSVTSGNVADSDSTAPMDCSSSSSRKNDHTSSFEGSDLLFSWNSSLEQTDLFQRRSSIYENGNGDWAAEQQPLRYVPKNINGVDLFAVAATMNLVVVATTTVSVEDSSNKYLGSYVTRPCEGTSAVICDLQNCSVQTQEFLPGSLHVGAINICDWESLKATFYPECPVGFKAISSKIPIFYCEFSQKRGPQLAEALRKYDRKRNEWRYPDVDYKEIYVLDRGYKNFFEEGYTHLCEPPSYVTMLEVSHREDLKRFSMHRSRSAVELNEAINQTFRGFCEKNVKTRQNTCAVNSPTQLLRNPDLLWLSSDLTIAPRLVKTLRFSESPESPKHRKSVY